MDGIRGIRRLIISLGWLLISICLVGIGSLFCIYLWYVAVVTFVIGVIGFFVGINSSENIDDDIKNLLQAEKAIDNKIVENDTAEKNS